MRGFSAIHKENVQEPVIVEIEKMADLFDIAYGWGTLQQRNEAKQLEYKSLCESRRTAVNSCAQFKQRLQCVRFSGAG